MNAEPSGDYYDYTTTMQPERPWLLPCLWCEEPTLIAYSKAGQDEKSWPLPGDTDRGPERSP